MTVAELVAELSLYPSDMRVLVSGYEGGLDDPAPLKALTGVRSYDVAGMMGGYPASPDLVLDDLGEAPPFDAVVIPRP